MRIIFGGFTILVVLIVGALVAPQFIDLNKYKPQITSQVEKATGLNVTIGGNLSLSILPVPHAKIEDLTVVAPNQKDFTNLLTMKSAEVSVELLPLLKKEVKVSSVTLVEPDITIEILADGTPSWQTEKIKSLTDKNKSSEQNANASNDPAATEQSVTENSNTSNNKLESVAFDKLEIQGGKLAFVNHQTNAKYSVTDVNTTLKADSLSGPFSGQGDMVYNAQKLAFDIEAGALPNEGTLPIKAKIEVPDVNGVVAFDGVAAIKGALDVQGQTKISTKSIGGLLAVISGKNDGSLDQDLGIEGLLSATESTIKFDNLKISTGDFTGEGKISVQNFKDKNPLLVTGDIKSSNALNLNPFLKSPSKTEAKKSPEGATPKTATNKDIVPSSLTLPMAINVDVNLDVAGLRFQKYNLRGVNVGLAKKDKAIKSVFKILEMPGQAKAEGALSIQYASSSQSSKTGQVTYSDPSITYKVDGNIGQLAAFLSEFAPDVDAKAITKNYNSAKFNLDGTFNGGAILLNQSAVQLDDLTVGLKGNYKPASSPAGRASGVIDMTAGTIDLAKFTGNKTSSSTSEGNSESKPSSVDASKALDPIRNLSLPLDLDFDVSIQKLLMDGKTLSGLRADGKILTNKITLDTLSVQDYAGANLSLKGAIGNLKELSGIDLTAYIKTSDLKSFAKSMNVDVSKIPSSVSSLEASVEGKGAIENLNFASNVKAIGGSVDASGVVKNALKTPAFSDLALRVIHPNANNAIKAVSTDYKGSDALNQAVDFYAKVNSNGKVYDLSNIKAKLGTSDFTGNLKIDMSNKVTGVSGDINAGKLALDSLLGAKGSSTKSSGGSSSTSSSSSSSGKWSDTPINLSWMNSNNIDINFAAENLTYGKWNFANPSTALKISDGIMKVSNLKAGVFGGNATLNTTVNASPVSIDLSSNMSGIDLEQLVSALSNSNRFKASGDVSFKVDVKGAGNSSRALISNLNGTSNIDGNNIIIQGFDLAKIAQGLSTEEKLSSSLQNFASGALQGGQTSFNTLDGDYDIQNGIVNISKMILDGDAAVINSTGQADLPKWYLNVNNEISLKNVADFDPVNIELKGSISNPKTFGTNILEDYLKQKLQRKLGKELPNLLGDDVTNKLQQFGIVPGADGTTKAPSLEGLVNGLLKPKTETKQEAAPTPAPVPVESSPSAEPAAPAEPEAAPTPQPEPEAAPEPTPEPTPEPAPTPEAAVEKLLNGGNAEEAVNDLIQGLF